MSFHAVAWNGETIDAPSVSQMRALLASLKDADEEHPDCWLQHESGWSLSFSRSSRLIWENVEEGNPRHLASASAEKTLELWTLLSQGKIQEIEAGVDWIDGYGE
jgi:hypothetical protein